MSAFDDGLFEFRVSAVRWKLRQRFDYVSDHQVRQLLRQGLTMHTVYEDLSRRLRLPLVARMDKLIDLFYRR